MRRRTNWSRAGIGGRLGVVRRLEHGQPAQRTEPGVDVEGDGLGRSDHRQHRSRCGLSHLVDRPWRMPCVGLGARQPARHRSRIGLSDLFF